ncbi:MAG: sugar transferase [Solirubrobacteraceae bacterium]
MLRKDSEPGRLHGVMGQAPAEHVKADEIARAGPSQTLVAQPVRRNHTGWLVDGPGWPWLAGALDVVGLGGGLLAGLLATSEHRGATALASLLAFPLAGVPALIIARSRGRQMDAGALDDLWPLVAPVSVAAMLASALGLLATGNGSGSTTLVIAWGVALALLGATHAAVRLVRRAARVRGVSGQPTLIVGAGKVGARIARRLSARPQYGLHPVGFLDWAPPPADLVGGRPVPVLGEPGDLAGVITQTHARHVVLAFSARPDRLLTPLLRTCDDLGVDVSIVPRLFEHTSDRMTYEPMGGLPLLGLDGGRTRGRRIAAKHGLDRLVAVVVLIVAAPLLAAISLAILVTSGRPIVFRQRRLGCDGHEFDLLKFCTMRGAPPDPVRAPDLDADQAPGGVEGDDRRTAVGRLLRGSSLDELMQLVNVLRGDMSLVGPRPERPEFVGLFSDSLDRYSDRHRVRPGITGMAQVKGLRGQTSLTERVELDNYYIEHWSFALDLKILIRTLLAAFHVPE